MKAWELSPASRVRYMVERSVRSFVEGLDIEAMAAYEAATYALDQITHPLEFLEAFLLVEHVNLTYVRSSGE